MKHIKRPFAVIFMMLAAPAIAQGLQPQLTLDKTAGTVSMRNRSANANVPFATLVGTTWAQDAIGTVDARRYGVTCNGATDDTTALNTALGANVGKRVQLPPGACIYRGGGVLGNGEVLVGAARNATSIAVVTVASPIGGTLFAVSGAGAGIEHLNITAYQPQTSGTFVRLTGSESYIDDFVISGDFNAITSTAVLGRIRHGHILNASPGATRIIVMGGDSSQLIDDVVLGAESDSGNTRAGIEIKNNSALMITNSQVISHNVGLLIDPSSSAENVLSLYVVNCFFDFSKTANILIAPTGTGSFARSRFADTWAGDGYADGVVIQNSGSGIVEGIHFADLHAIINTGSGVKTIGTVRDLEFVGGELAQNATGFNLGSGTSAVIITAAHIGNYAGGLQPNGTGILIASGASDIIISSNIIKGNTTAQITDNSGTGISKRIVNNIGVADMLAN